MFVRFCFLLTLSLATIANSDQQKILSEELKKEAALFSYGYLEIIQYAEMHIAHGMGWQTKIFYNGIEIEKRNSAGRPLGYSRDFVSQWNGVENKCKINTLFKYSTPTRLENFTIAGDCSFISLPGLPAFEVYSHFTKSFSIKKVSETDYDLTINFTHKNIKTGEKIEFFETENPIRLKVKNSRVESIKFNGKVESKYFWGPHNWSFISNFKSTEFIVKRPCQRAYGTSNATQIGYSNLLTKEKFNWVSDIELDGNGSKVTIDGAPYRYDIPKCYPW